jgi:hypothetical protein
MNMTRSVLAAWLLAVVVPAQAGDASKPPANPAEYDALVAEWTAAQKTYLEGMKQMQTSEEYKKARADKDAQKINELTAKLPNPGKTFGPRALALADQSKGDEGIRYLAYAATTFNDKDTGKAVLERAVKNHVKSPKLGDLLENAMALSRQAGQPETEAFLDQVIAESPHALPKAWAYYWKGKAIQQANRPKRDATEEEKAALAAALKRADEMFAAAAPLAAGTEHADKIGAPIFEKERLQPGMEVPEVAGEDVDGVAFKLSDYRGKVVLIDFWGFW